MWYNSVEEIPLDIYLETVLNEMVDDEEDEDTDDEDGLMEPGEEDESDEYICPGCDLPFGDCECAS